jgi:hypothetical protein
VIARHDTSTVNRLRPSHTLAPHIAVRQLYRHNLAHMCTHAPRPACAHTLHAHPQPEAGEVAGQRRGTCGDGGVHLSHCRERVFKGQSHSMHSSATHQWRLCASYCSTHTHTHTHAHAHTHARVVTARPRTQVRELDTIKVRLQDTIASVSEVSSLLDAPTSCPLTHPQRAHERTIVRQWPNRGALHPHVHSCAA